jgi:hypothetical protein
MFKPLILIAIFTINFTSIFAQSLRYFEFNTKCFTNGNNTWQDSSFIAATSSKDIIDSVLADLAKPDSLRKMILGKVDTGNRGYNHNGTHWFLWHFIEDKWLLTEAAVEICDGCPTNVDKCVSCYMGNSGYCPWSSHVTREIINTSASDKSDIYEIIIYPNPIQDKMEIKISNINPIEFILYNITSGVILRKSLTNSITINTEAIPVGIYFYEIRFRNNIKRGVVIKV